MTPIVCSLNLGIFSHYDGPDQVVGIVGLPVLEDGQVNFGCTFLVFFICIFEGEIPLHVLHGKSILFRHRLNHELEVAFFLCSLYNLVSKDTDKLIFIEDYFLRRRVLFGGRHNFGIEVQSW